MLNFSSFYTFSTCFRPEKYFCNFRSSHHWDY